MVQQKGIKKKSRFGRKVVPTLERLREMFRRKELIGTEKPKDVYNKHPEFHESESLPVFRGRFSRVRDEFRSQRQSGEQDHLFEKHLSSRIDFNANNSSFLGAEICESEELQPKCSEDNLSWKKQQETIDEDSDFHDSTFVGYEQLSRISLFQPLYYISYWDEPGTLTNMATVAVVLPSGVKGKNCRVRYNSDGNYVEVQVKWPIHLAKPLQLMRPWLAESAENRITPTHPMIGGFEKILRRLKEKEEDDVWSTARIPLEIDVQPGNVEKYCHSYSDVNVESTNIVIIELAGVRDEYCVSAECQEFKQV